MKKILFLGAAPFQLPPIDYALSRGYEVLTCDNKSENPGHHLAHRSFSVSTTDREGVLALALREKPDAILSYGSDVSMPTVAWVARQLKRPSASEESVKVLTHKGHFRNLLKENGIQNKTRFAVFRQAQDKEARAFADELGFPFLAKPVDAAGSKGVSLVRSAPEIQEALKLAFASSRTGEVIFETYFKRKGPQICGNGFIRDGKIAFAAYGDGYFYPDTGWMAPWGESFPSSHSPAVLEDLTARLENILSLAGYRYGIFNVDAHVGEDGEIFIVEVAPRNGGNFMDEAIRLGQGVDLAAAAVECALSNDYVLPPRKKTKDEYYACYMAHSLKPGKLKEVSFSPAMRAHLVRYVPYLKKENDVHPFTQGNFAAGNLILKFSAEDQMRRLLSQMPELCRAELA